VPGIDPEGYKHQLIERFSSAAAERTDPVVDRLADRLKAIAAKQRTNPTAFIANREFRRTHR
jgi:hypothetical protein